MINVDRGFASKDQVQDLTGNFGETSKRLGLESRQDDRALPRIGYEELKFRFGVDTANSSFDVTVLQDPRVVQIFADVPGARGIAKLTQKGRPARFPIVVVPALPGQAPMVEMLVSPTDVINPRDPKGSSKVLTGLQQQILDMALAQNMPEVGADGNCSSSAVANVGDVAHAALISSRLQPGNIHKDAHNLGQGRTLTKETMQNATIYTPDGHKREVPTALLPVAVFDEISFTQPNQIAPTGADFDTFAAGAGLIMAATATREHVALVPNIDVLANQQAMAA